MEKSIGLIGIGAWGKKLAKELHEIGILSCVLKSSQNEILEWIDANIPGTQIIENIEDIFNNPDIKGLIIATPIDTHFEIALRALKSNKHVFLEKPATDDEKQLEKLIDLAENKGLILQVGYEFIFSDKLQTLKKQIENKSIKSINFKWMKWGSFKAHPVINLLVHELSMLKELGFDDIEITDYKSEKVADITESTYPEIIHIKAHSGETEITFEIDISVKDIKEHSIIVETDSEKLEWIDGGENLLEQELVAFAQSIHTGEKPKTNGAFAKGILETVNKISWKQ